MQGIRVNGTAKDNVINGVWFPISEQPAKRKSENYQRYQKRYSPWTGTICTQKE